MKQTMSAKRLWAVLAALVCAAGVWLFAQRVLVPYQVADAAAQGRPRGGYLSDLYPRWLGARELLLRGRDPYSAEVTREIQAGYYGRALDPDRSGWQNYQQGFFYPVYVAFYLAPTIHLPFGMVQKGFFWMLLGLAIMTTPLWLRVLRWRASLWVQAIFVILTIGSVPFMEGLKLQQITLFVVPLLAVAMALLAVDWQIPAGVLLALTTIKPQLVWLVLLWLTMWTAADWRRRYRWATAFVISMVILCAASEWYLPHWIVRFWQALHEYHSYTGERPLMDELIGVLAGRAFELVALAVMAAVCWRERRHPANTGAFAFTLSLVLATTVLVVPSHGLYNQMLLVPALMIMLKERRMIWQRSVVNRVLSVITIALISWPWLWCFGLSVFSFILPPETVERGWAIPFWTAPQIPVGVAAAMLVYAGQRTFAASGEATTS
jgi:hypothetical protein